jgi:hypothetical protein
MADKKLSDKLKESVSFHDIEGFRKKYATEILTVIALAIAAISSALDFFTGPKLTIFVFALATIVAIFFPDPVQKSIKKIYGFFYMQEPTTQLIISAVRIVVAIFVPFVLFGAFGLLAGLSFHYYTRRYEHSGEINRPKPPKNTSNDEHD